MSDFVPDVEEVRDSLVYLNKYHAKQYGDVDLLVVGSETAAQFDRMIAEVRREAAEKALKDAAEELYRVSRTGGAVMDAHMFVADACIGILRDRAEAYRQEGEEG